MHEIMFIHVLWWSCGFVGEVAGPTSGVEEEDENEEVDDVVAGAGADAKMALIHSFLLKTGILVSWNSCFCR